MREVRVSETARRLNSSIGVDAVIKNVVTDSRMVQKGDLFVAIKGENFDGDLFAQSALEKGACAVVVSRLCDGVDPEKAIVTADTKRALIKIGGIYRDGFDIPFVGITGSVGKTTTKEFIATVLGEKYKVHKTEGNHNNEIGVPMTLIALDDTAEAGVIEMGMCGFGEIHDLVTEVRPAVGVITSIGVSHIELLGSRENILKAKLELLDGMEKGSPLFLCGDNDLLCTVKNDDYKIYRYGITNSDCDIIAKDIAQSGSSMKFVIVSPWGEYPATIPLVGMHNILDALAAFGVGCVMGVEPLKAAKALEKYVPVGLRQKVTRHNGMVIVEDCYNCSPDSLRAAALALAASPCEGRRIMVVSDMLELGEKSRDMHRECGKFIARQEIDMLVGCGEETESTIQGAYSAGMERCKHYPDKETLCKELLRTMRAGDVIWFKASRGMKLEEVSGMLLGRGE